MFKKAAVITLTLILASLYIAFPSPEKTASAELIDASGLLGQDNYISRTKGLSNTKFDWVSDVALDTVNHRLFVTDGNHRVLVFNLDVNNQITDKTADYVLGQTDFNTNTHASTQSKFYAPAKLAYDSNNQRLFVSDSLNSRIMVFNLSSGITNGMNASYVLGQTNFTTNIGWITQSKFDFPHDIAYDSNNQRLFVDEWNSHRVMVFDLSGGISNGMNASYVLGQSNFTTGTSGTTQSKFNRPDGLNYDSGTQKLFVTDIGNNRIMVFNLSSGITNGMNASYVLGQSNFTTGTFGTTQSKFNRPYSTAYDFSNQKLFVTDIGNNRIMVFNLSSGITNGMNASYVLGQSNFTTGTSGTTQNRLWDPGGLTYDSDNQRLFVADSANYRVLSFEQPATLTINKTEIGNDGSDHTWTFDIEKYDSSSSSWSKVADASIFIPAAETQGTATVTLETSPTSGWTGTFRVRETGVPIRWEPSQNPSNNIQLSFNNRVGVANFTDSLKSFQVKVSAENVNGNPLNVDGISLQSHVDATALNVSDWNSASWPEEAISYFFSIGCLTYPDRNTWNCNNISPASYPYGFPLDSGTLVAQTAGYGSAGAIDVGGYYPHTNIKMTAPKYIYPDRLDPNVDEYFDSNGNVNTAAAGVYRGCSSNGVDYNGWPYPECSSMTSVGVLEFYRWEKFDDVQSQPSPDDDSNDFRAEVVKGAQGSLKAVYGPPRFKIELCADNDAASCHQGGANYNDIVVGSSDLAPTIPFQAIVDSDGNEVTWQVEEISRYDGSTGSEEINTTTTPADSNPEGVDEGGNTVNVPDYPLLSDGITFEQSSESCTPNDGGGLSTRCIKFNTTENVRKVRVKATVAHDTDNNSDTPDDIASAYFDILVVPPKKLYCNLALDPSEIYIGMTTRTTSDSYVAYSRKGYPDDTLTPEWRIDWKDGAGLSAIQSGFSFPVITSGTYTSLLKEDDPSTAINEKESPDITFSSVPVDVTTDTCPANLKVKQNTDNEAWPTAPSR